VAEYRAQNRGGKGVTGHKPKEEDFVENMFVTSTHDDIMFFTNYGKVYRIKGYEIPEAQKTARGRAIVNIIQLDDGEKVNAMIPCKEGQEGFIAMATKNGLIKKTALEEFESIRKTGKIAIKLNDGDELVSVIFTSGSDEILIGTYKGKCLRFYEGLDEERGTYGLKPIGRDTQGVKAMDLDDDDYLIGMSVTKEGHYILTVTENGYGKLSRVDDYRLQGRAGKGIKSGNYSDKTGKPICLTFIDPESDIMMIYDTVIVIRLRASDISILGRDTQGVIIMRLNTGVVSTVAAVPHEDEEEVAGDEETLENVEEGAEEVAEQE
ncbi:MAG: DNA gyrase subunit A, partial [Clostridia bacterium]|nr:DNA gyrase subunit A [Clostridia bacterium]